MDAPANLTVIAMLLGGGGLSLATLFVLFQKHIRGKPLLRYEPRRRVPWGMWGALFVIYIVATRVISALMATDEQLGEVIDPADFARSGWLNIGLFLVLTVVGCGCLAAVCKATRRDLGLPDGWRQLLADARIGTIAFLASLAPVYLVQVLLIVAIQPESRHPLLDQLAQSATPQVLLTAFGLAVVAAPLFEEFAFRLLLQGALERMEDSALRLVATERPQPANGNFSDSTTSDGDAPEAQNPYASPAVEIRAGRLEAVDKPPPKQSDQPPPEQGLLPGLPHGWAPVLASGLLFGVAHYGHGADPVALFLFGTVLGYLYQRTHRIVPCIVTHMLFNAFSLTIAWLQHGSG